MGICTGVAENPAPCAVLPTVAGSCPPAMGALFVSRAPAPRDGLCGIFLSPSVMGVRALSRTLALRNGLTGQGSLLSRALAPRGGLCCCLPSPSAAMAASSTALRIFSGT